MNALLRGTSTWLYVSGMFLSNVVAGLDRAGDRPLATAAGNAKRWKGPSPARSSKSKRLINNRSEQV